MAKRIKAFIMDIDGVLTDGRIGYGCASDDEIKFFDVKDGLRLKLLARAGIVPAVISGRSSKANARRMRELGIDHYIEGCPDKAEGLLEVCRSLGIGPDECLYIGDDLIDLAPVRMAGIGVAVGDAAPELKDAADWTTERCGGRGAVAETIEKLLRQMELWEEIVVSFSGA